MRLSYLILSLLLLTPVLAHVPQVGQGYSLDDATVVNQPLKSWVYYSEYELGKPIYYQFNLTAGDRLIAGLLSLEKDFVPDLTIMGPGLTAQYDEELHEEFQPPIGYEVIHIHGNPDHEKEYEPFTPSSYYQSAYVNFTVNETGTYYLIADSASGSGKIGVIIGYEEYFTIIEWFKVPFDVAFVHNWEGQDYLLILWPFIVILISGVLINCYYLKLNWSQALAYIGSLTYFGSGAILLQQMIIGLIGAVFEAWMIIVTLMFVLLPVLLGYSVLRKVLAKKLTKGQRARLFLYGLAGFVFWAGYLIGPVFVMISALIPTTKRVKK